MFDLDRLAKAIKHHGPVARVVVADVKGSAPREVGTSMLIWAEGLDGTIGGGRLEWQATATARQMLQQGPQTAVHRMALGPAVRQCCGGHVAIITEIYDAARLGAITSALAGGELWSRAVEAEATPAPPPKGRAAHRTPPQSLWFGDGWLHERLSPPRQRVQIYGAGHVGRALASVLAPFAWLDVWLVDNRKAQFDALPEGIHQVRDTSGSETIAAAPDQAAHFIMTPDHETDLALCHALLAHDFAYAGLIGSATKWARFRSRLKALGHDSARIARITCPIGDPALGKHPQAIAVGVAAALLARGRFVPPHESSA
ncbi:MAG: xanthine dehydrogenase accessory protein XdhC [Rhodobacteraceae bacterium]|nr:xanthine dehydrogenase accessory protein XdhC [Paracoccaceae bacterium]